MQIEDRTETRRAEQLRSDFIANASHELRTPLASIIGYIETLQNHARDDPEARERFLAIMAREAGRMQRLVDDLMSLSRIELTEHVRPVEAWSLNRIAAESAAALLPVAAPAGRRARDRPARRAGARVLGDRDQLAQVFTNLIDNAMKYGGSGRDGARIRRRAEPGASRTATASPSRTTGPGIAREHIHRLTERFYRVNVASSRNKGGTGLGLAIVKHILNRHEGRLEIASTPGKGSAFTVWLPRRRRRLQRATPAEAPAARRISVPPERVPSSQKRRETVHKPVAARRYTARADRSRHARARAGTDRQEQDDPTWRISFGLRRGPRPGPGQDLGDGRASARSCSSKALRVGAEPRRRARPRGDRARQGARRDGDGARGAAW